MRSSTLLPTLLALLPAALAKTDLSGCVSSETVAFGGASLIWYLPDTGEICEPLDCGGGRAPPKTTVPGCPQYVGTDAYSPSFLQNFQASSTPVGEATGTETAPAVTSAPATTTTDTTSAEATGGSSTGEDATGGGATGGSSTEGSATGGGTTGEGAASTGATATDASAGASSTGGVAAGGAGGAVGMLAGLVAGIAVL